MHKSLKDGLKAIIDTYKATVDAYQKNIKETFDELRPEFHRYTKEGLVELMEERVKPVMDACEKASVVFNQKFCLLVEDAEKDFIKQNTGKAVPDAPLKVNNVLHMIQMMEPEKDEDLQMIMKEFVEADDFDHLKLFENLVGKSADLLDPQGLSLFPSTFGRLHQYESVLNMFTELKEIGADGLFLHKSDIFDGECSLSLSDGHGFQRVYGLPVMETYSETVGEQNAVELAEQIDSASRELNNESA